MTEEQLRQSFEKFFMKDSQFQLSDISTASHFGVNVRLDLDPKQRLRLGVKDGATYQTFLWFNLNKEVALRADPAPLLVQAFFGLVMDHEIVRDYSKLTNVSVAPTTLTNSDFTFKKAESIVCLGNKRISSINELITQVLKVFHREMNMTKTIRWTSTIRRWIKNLVYILISFFSLVTWGDVWTAPSRASSDSLTPTPARTESSFFGFKTRIIPLAVFLSTACAAFVFFLWIDFRPHWLILIAKYNILSLSFSLLLYLVWERGIGRFFYFLSERLYAWSLKR